MTKALVSVVILTYNGAKTIRDCLNSVFGQNYDNIEIIVVDNASTDETIRIVSRSQKTQALVFKIIQNKKNIGFAGRNIGIQESRGEFVLCINQDVSLESNFVSEAIKTFKQDEKIGALQGKILQKNPEIRIIDTTSIVAFKSRRFIDRGQGEEDKGQYEKIEEVFGCNGAVSFFRKKCLDDIKTNINGSSEYYDPDFFMYKEDIDLSWRIRLYGWKIIYNPAAIAWTERTSKTQLKGAVAGVIKTRIEQTYFVKKLSFKNHRLTIIKNDLLWLFFKHLPWVLPREIGAWLYVLFFEPKTWPAIGKLFRQMPRAWQKRKIIMKNKKAGAGEIEKWFK